MLIGVSIKCYALFDTACGGGTNTTNDVCSAPKSSDHQRCDDRFTQIVDVLNLLFASSYARGHPSVTNVNISIAAHRDSPDFDIDVSINRRDDRRDQINELSLFFLVHHKLLDADHI